jgi:Flp pilus assembly protein TadB
VTGVGTPAWVAVLAAAGAVAVLLPPVIRLPHARGPSPGAGPPSRTRDIAVLRVVAAGSALLGCAVLVGPPVGPVLGAVAAAVTWEVTGRVEPAAVRRRRERLEAAVPHVVDLLAACLAVGLSPATALARVAAAVEPPASEELDVLVQRLRMGVDPVTVWRDLSGHPQLGAVGRTVARALESGASVADALGRLSEDLRRRARAEVENRARSVGVKAAVPLGVCLLPAFVLVGVVPLVAGSIPVLLRP